MSSDIKNRKALEKIAGKLSKVQQGVAKDEKGNTTETYLKYLSLMYGPDEAEIVQHLEIMPNATRVTKLAKQIGKEKNEIKEILDKIADKGFIMKMGGSYALPNPLMIFDHYQ